MALCFGLYLERNLVDIIWQLAFFITISNISYISFNWTNINRDLYEIVDFLIEFWVISKLVLLETIENIINFVNEWRILIKFFI